MCVRNLLITSLVGVFLGLGAVLVLHNSPPFYHFLASFLFNSQVSCDNLYTRDINATFSSKTPYQYNAIINNESEFSGCTAKKVIHTVHLHNVCNVLEQCVVYRYILFSAMELGFLQKNTSRNSMQLCQTLPI